MDSEKKSLNGLFSLLNIRHPKKFKVWPLAEWETSPKNQLGPSKKEGLDSGLFAGFRKISKHTHEGSGNAKLWRNQQGDPLHSLRHVRWLGRGDDHPGPVRETSQTKPCEWLKSWPLRRVCQLASCVSSRAGHQRLSNRDSSFGEKGTRGNAWVNSGSEHRTKSVLRPQRRFTNSTKKRMILRVPHKEKNSKFHPKKIGQNGPTNFRGARGEFMWVHVTHFNHLDLPVWGATKMGSLTKTGLVNSSSLSKGSSCSVSRRILLVFGSGFLDGCRSPRKCWDQWFGSMGYNLDQPGKPSVPFF